MTKMKSQTFAIPYFMISGIYAVSLFRVSAFIREFIQEATFFLSFGKNHDFWTNWTNNDPKWSLKPWQDTISWSVAYIQSVLIGCKPWIENTSSRPLIFSLFFFKNHDFWTNWLKNDPKSRHKLRKHPTSLSVIYIYVVIINRLISFNRVGIRLATIFSSFFGKNHDFWTNWSKNYPKSCLKFWQHPIS